jgi:uncharacterized protein YgiM (DUF1202 family)
MKKNISTFIMVAVLLFTLAMPAFASTTKSTNTSTSVSSAAEKASSSSSSDDNSITFVVSTSKLYVRSGPNASYSKLGTLAKDATVTGVDTNGWVKFTFNDKTAYCSDKYLTKANATATTASTPASASSSANSVINTYVVTSAKLTIRSGAGTSYSKLGYLKKGATESGAVESGWLKFTYDGKTAYCSTKYLKEQNS